MNNAVLTTPPPQNEPVLHYAPGSPERDRLKTALQDLKSRNVEIPAMIGGQEVFTGNTESIHPPHEIDHVLGRFHKCGPSEVKMAIDAALKARKEWSQMNWTDRAAIFLRAAELLSGPRRMTLNAATMLGQSKNAFQAEIDSACELIDFLRFNIHFAEQIYRNQPLSAKGTWNKMQYRPLEGFVFAVTPFNFTAIAGNLPIAPAIMGNVVLWKPASTALFSAYYLYGLLEEAGLPPGVINMLPGDGPAIGDPVFSSPEFTGLHFTGSTSTFQRMWQNIGRNIASYKTYPRIVGETGGKDFIVAHDSADPDAVATAIVRGSFEYQGQKCSAASRCYISSGIWPAVKASLFDQLAEAKMGGVEDFNNFINAVIDSKSYESISNYIKRAREDEDAEVLIGGNYSNEAGYFIEPTVLEVTDPRHVTMCEEIFGPVVSIYVYDGHGYSETLQMVNDTSPYSLTGAIFASDRKAIIQALNSLEDAAGNFYINDKPTGAVVGQQPFGGARASGTNDKAGSYLNLIRWVSARTIKETFSPPRHFGYPFLDS